MHLGLLDGPFVPHNVISAPDSPVPLPKFQMAPRLHDLMSSGSKKGTQIHYPFLSKSPSKRIPSRFPKWASVERHIHLQSNFTSPYISLFIFLSESSLRDPPPCSLTVSPWTGILCHQSHWSIHSFIHSFIHSIHVCLPESPKRIPPAYGK